MKLLFSFFCILCLTSCLTLNQGLTQAPPQTPVENSEFKNLSMIQIDDWIQKNPTHSKAPEALYILAKKLEKKQDFRRAQKAYRRMTLLPQSQPLYKFLGHLNSAQIDSKNNKLEEARINLDAASQFAATDNQLIKVLIEQEDIFNKFKKNKALFQIYAKQEEFGLNKASQIQNLISSQASFNEVQEFEKLNNNKNYLPWIYQRLKKEYSLNFNHAQAQKYSQLLNNEMQNETQLTDTKDDQVGPVVFKNKIGVLLPLTGKHKIIGEAFLHGLQDGLGISQGQNFQLIIKDTESSTHKTLMLAQELLSTESVSLLVGGVLGHNEKVLSEFSELNSLSFISLSQNPLLEKKWSFSSQFSKFDSAYASLKQLHETKGIAKIAILYPEDNFGFAYKKAFEDAAKKLGLMTTHSEPYSLKKKTLNKALRVISQRNPGQRRQEYYSGMSRWKKKYKNARSKPQPEEVLSPILDFDALIIADVAKPSAIISANLALFDIDGIDIVGTHLWEAESLKRIGRDYVKGAIYSSFLNPSQDQSCYAKTKEQFSPQEMTFVVQSFDIGSWIASGLNALSNPQVHSGSILNSLKNPKSRDLPFGCFDRIVMSPEHQLKRKAFTQTVQ